MNLKIKRFIWFSIKLIIIIFIFKFLIHSVIVVVFSNEYEGYRKRIIIEQYEKNKKEFYDSVSELEEIYEISFSKKELETEIIIFQDKKEPSEPGEGFKMVNKKDYYKYEKTLKLMKKNKIQSVYKRDENVEYEYNLPPCWLQKIIFIKNKEAYLFLNENREYEKIDEDWYYSR